MEPRLTRSRSESVIAGVCGGLGVYFNVDPVIVRLIFVLVGLTTGISFIVYPVLWAVMPKAPVPVAPPIGAPGYQFEQREQPMYVMHEAGMREPVSARRPGSYGVVPPSQYNFDPITGQPVARGPASTGQTAPLGQDPMQHPITGPNGQPYATGGQRRWRWFGFAMLAIGALALADAMGISTEFVFPVLMIGIGMLLLRRK